MNVLIRCLSNEAIENTISVLNYRFDKVIYFSYEKTINTHRKHIETFVRNVCKVQNVDFITLNRCNKDKIREYLNNYLNNDDKIFFDLKGAKNTCSIVFISFAIKNRLPIYTWNVRKNEIEIMNEDSSYSLDTLENKRIDLTVQQYIEMLGGKVLKCENDFVESNKEVIEKMINIRKDYSYIWSYFATIVQNHKNESNTISIENISNVLSSFNNNLVTIDNIYSIVDRMEHDGLIKILEKNSNRIKYKFLYDSLNTIFGKSGNVFEYTVYFDNMIDKTPGEILLGALLDWDGKIQKENIDDVTNEIDVIKLDDYILSFISCKDKHSLDKECIYELQTVASKFGDKYVKKMIACSQNCNKGFVSRAKDLKIRVKVYN